MEWTTTPYLLTSEADVLDAINKTGDYNDNVAASLKTICSGFAEKGAY